MSTSSKTESEISHSNDGGMYQNDLIEPHYAHSSHTSKGTQVEVHGRVMESQHPGMHCQYPLAPQMNQRGDKIIWPKYPWEIARDEQARANMEHIIDETVVHEEEGCIVPPCTNQPSNSEGPSVQSQQNRVSNSQESNPMCSLRLIDSVIIYRLPSYGSSTRRYYTPMDIVFELFHPNPLNHVSETSFLICLRSLRARSLYINMLIIISIGPSPHQTCLKKSMWIGFLTYLVKLLGGTIEL